MRLIGEMTESNPNDGVAKIATAVDEQSAATCDIAIAFNSTRGPQSIQGVSENVNRNSPVSTKISENIADVSLICYAWISPAQSHPNPHYFSGTSYKPN